MGYDKVYTARSCCNQYTLYAIRYPDVTALLCSFCDVDLSKR